MGLETLQLVENEINNIRDNIQKRHNTTLEDLTFSPLVGIIILEKEDIDGLIRIGDLLNTDLELENSEIKKEIILALGGEAYNDLKQTIGKIFARQIFQAITALDENRIEMYLDGLKRFNGLDYDPYYWLDANYNDPQFNANINEYIKFIRTYIDPKVGELVQEYFHD